MKKMTFNQYAKDRIKDDPDWEPTYIKRVTPSWKRLRRILGIKTKKGGRGITKPFNDTTKAQRQQSRASRRINRK